MEEKKPSTIEKIHLASTIIFGLIITVLLGFLNLQLDRQKAAYEFIKVISDKDGLTCAKGLALSSLLRFKLVEPDLVLSSGYNYENQHGPGILKDVMYEYGLKCKPIRQPLGYVAFPATKENNQYVLKGWAIDKNTSAIQYAVYLNNKQITTTTFTPYSSLDVNHIFTKYTLPTKVGIVFKFNIPESSITKTNRLKIRIVNDKALYTDILDCEVKFTKDGIERIPSYEKN